MATVNAPCCLLSRNEFYRSISPTDKTQAVNIPSDRLMEPKQKQMTACVTNSKHQDFSGNMTDNWIEGLILRSPASSKSSHKHLSPADHVVK